MMLRAQFVARAPKAPWKLKNINPNALLQASSE